MPEEKQALRAQARKHRAAIDLLSEDPMDAADLFFKTIRPDEGKIIAAYFPTGNEFDPIPVLERAIEQGIECALPAIEKETRVLKFFKWNAKTEMSPNQFGIPEPINAKGCAPDIIIAPLLAFDRKGTRLGQGGGYYDTTLEHLRRQKDITAVGMAYSKQAVLFKLPVEEHDQPLEWVITPKEAHYFGEV